MQRHDPVLPCASMQRSDFHYNLPQDLVATRPCDARTGSRLLYLDPLQDMPADRQFAELPELLAPGDLLVFNNTRVIPARIFGRKPLAPAARARWSWAGRPRPVRMTTASLGLTLVT